MENGSIHALSSGQELMLHSWVCLDYWRAGNSGFLCMLKCSIKMNGRRWLTLGREHLLYCHIGGIQARKNKYLLTLYHIRILDFSCWNPNSGLEESCNVWTGWYIFNLVRFHSVTWSSNSLHLKFVFVLVFLCKDGAFLSNSRVWQSTNRLQIVHAYIYWIQALKVNMKKFTTY